MPNAYYQNNMSNHQKETMDRYLANARKFHETHNNYYPYPSPQRGQISQAYHYAN